jgi:hypothetical protein
VQRGSKSDDVHHVDKGTLALHCANHVIIIIITAMEQRRDIGKYSFVNRTIKLKPTAHRSTGDFPL